MNLRSSALLFSTFLFLLPSEAAEPALSKAEAIKLANEAAKKEGIDLSKYKEPDAEYEPDRKGGSWFIFYNGKPDEKGQFVFGNHFGIHVESKSHKTTISRGR